MKYRRKPGFSEANQWFPGTTVPGVQQEDEFGLNPGQFYVTTIHGQRAYLAPGDMVVLEPDGVHYYPCKPDVFFERHDHDPVE